VDSSRRRLCCRAAASASAVGCRGAACRRACSSRPLGLWRLGGSRRPPRHPDPVRRAAQQWPAAQSAAPPPLHLLSAAAVPPAVALVARALSASGAWAALADRARHPDPVRRAAQQWPAAQSAAPPWRLGASRRVGGARADAQPSPPRRLLRSFAYTQVGDFSSV
jgi:hypothetical protein